MNGSDIRELVDSLSLTSGAALIAGMSSIAALALVAVRNLAVRWTTALSRFRSSSRTHSIGCPSGLAAIRRSTPRGRRSFSSDGPCQEQLPRALFFSRFGFATDVGSARRSNVVDRSGRRPTRSSGILARFVAATRVRYYFSARAKRLRRGCVLRLYSDSQTTRASQW
jgi:hypothetical protein